MQKALRQHIVQDLDACMEAGCIKVYYQPVMRTLTGEICGMEALARWDDPEYGLLPPIAFIPVLEEAHLIHKLDMCIIQQICEEYAIREKRHEELATVSFNLSRMDFQYCDIHSFIDETIRANRLPRDIFRVEITESTMEDDEKRMHDVIDRFWDSGLRVWMDDFGSGYSSLNVLKDYHFDTLKIDMVFMRDFDVRSREIITSVVDMSKRIGVHTLAEGVETEEQLAFLRSIGCEKAQGYYIGKPMPYEACIAHLAKNDLKIEAREKKQYYHDIGTINLMSPTPMFFQEGDEVDGEEALAGQIPLAILEVTDDGHIQYLFANDSYIRMLNSVGIEGTEEIEAAYEKTNTPFAQRFGQMIQRARQTGETETVNFVRSGRHCFAQMRRVAGYPGGAAYLCIFQNLSLGVEAGKEDTLATFANDLFTLYDEIELIDLNTGFSKNIYRTTQNLDTYNKRPAREELWDFAERQVYPEDREKYKEFMDPYTVEKRLDESIAPFISMPFRIMGADGIYAWKLQIYLYAGDKKDRRVLACTRRIDRNNLQLLKK
ncbi:MAG: EAL domain-containing protein, partial [Butyrivibrio sp.]|nr:EAL domain-containing protein [Butyrivibrio sp.]